MKEFLTQYWLECLFSLIIAGLTYLVKRFYTLWKNEKTAKQNDLLTAIKDELKTYNQAILDQKEAILTAEDAKLQAAIAEVKYSNDNLLSTVLEVQRKQFKTDCQYLLSNEVFITYEQFEDLYAEYELYEHLGGNGYGKALFDLVCEKYSTQAMSTSTVDALAEKMREIMHPDEGAKG